MFLEHICFTIVLSILNLCRYHGHYGVLILKPKLLMLGVSKIIFNWFLCQPWHLKMFLLGTSCSCSSMHSSLAFLLFYDVVCVQQGPCAFCVHYMSELDVRLWHWCACSFTARVSSISVFGYLWSLQFSSVILHAVDWNYAKIDICLMLVTMTASKPQSVASICNLELVICIT